MASDVEAKVVESHLLTKFVHSDVFRFHALPFLDHKSVYRLRCVSKYIHLCIKERDVLQQFLRFYSIPLTPDAISDRGEVQFLISYFLSVVAGMSNVYIIA